MKTALYAGVNSISFRLRNSRYLPATCGWYVGVLLSLISFSAVSTFGQGRRIEYFNPISSQTGGIHLYEATVSSGYFSNGYGMAALGTGTGSGVPGPATGNNPVTSIQTSLSL